MRTVLETTGQVCPFPVIEAEEAMEELSVGDELVIGFDCTQGTQTLPAWAGGCSIGNALVQTSLLSWQGWIALVFQVLGVGVAAWFLLIRPRQRRRAERAASRVPATV